MQTKSAKNQHKIGIGLKKKHSVAVRKNRKKQLVLNSIDTKRKIMAFFLALLMVLGLFASLLAEDKNTQNKTAKVNKSSNVLGNKQAMATLANDKLASMEQVKLANEEQAKLAELKAERDKLPYTKQELIYVSLDAKNKANKQLLTPQIYVVNYFEAKEDCTVTDYGNYSELSNLQPNKSWQVTTSGSTKIVKFQLNKGEFFYYQGKIENVALPWQISYSYELNGKEVSVQDLVHKSGQFKLNLAIKPNSASDTTFFDSYIMQVQLALPLSNFSNIKAEGAQISIAANKTNIVFMHLPKKSASYLITATAKDIVLPSSNFTALPLTFQMESNDLLDKQMGQLKELEFGISQLNQASNKLSGGYKKLNEGIGKLNIGSKELADGGIKLGTGAIEFNFGLQQYQSGLKQYLSGVAQLDGGLKQIKQGLSQKDLSSYLAIIKDLEKYLADLEAGTLNKKSLTDLSNELDTLIDTLTALRDLLSKNQSLLDKLLQLQVPDFDSSQLEKSLDKTIQLIDNTLSMLDKLNFNTTPQSAPNSEPSSEATPSSESSLESGSEASLEPSSESSLEASLEATPSSEAVPSPEPTPTKKATLKLQTETAQSAPNTPLEATTQAASNTPLKAAKQDAPITELELAPSTKSLIVANNLSTQTKATPNLDLTAPLKEQLNKLKQALSNTKAQLKEIKALADALQALKKQLAAQNTAKTAEAVINRLDETIKHLKAAKSLLDKLKEADPNKKLPEPKEIAKLLESIPKLLDGLNQLADGSAKLKANGTILDEKGDELVDGSNKLTAGIMQYIGGTQELAKGIDKLANGAMQLDKGFQAFQNGFKQLNQATNGMSEKAKAKIKETLKDLLGQNFKPHSFINSQNQTQTISQFVFIFPGTQVISPKTTSDKKADKAASPSKKPDSTKEQTLQKAANKDKSFFEKLKALFTRSESN